MSIKEQIIEDYNKGVGVTAIQKKYNISAGFLYTVLAGDSTPMRIKSDKLVKKMYGISDRMAKSIIYDYQDGEPIEKIYKRYGLHKNALYMILDMNNIPRRIKAKPKRSKLTSWLEGGK